MQVPAGLINILQGAKMNLKKLKILAVMMVTVVISFMITSCSEEGADVILPAEDDLTMYFLDVGQADSTILVSEGEAMLVDAGNREDSEFIMDYLYELGIDHLKYVVFTHPHEDHIGSGEDIVNNIDIDKIFMLDEYDEGIEGYLSRAIQRNGIETESPYPGDKAQLGECQITFIGPYYDYSDANDDSICLKVTHGANSVLFTGDAGTSPEHEMVDSSLNIEATILKAGHHGSSTSNSYYFLKAVNPEYAVISCGEDNMYGHPHRETLGRFNDVGAEIYRTDEQGTVVAVCDGSEIDFNCEGKKPTRPHVEEQEEAKYIGNLNSKKYHDPDCGGLPEPDNRTYFTSIEAAEKAGYSPCGRCNPN